MLDKDPNILQDAGMSITLFVVSVLFTLSIHHFSKTIPYIMQTPEAKSVLPFVWLPEENTAAVTLDRRSFRLQLEKLMFKAFGASRAI